MFYTCEQVDIVLGLCPQYTREEARLFCEKHSFHESTIVTELTNLILDGGRDTDDQWKSVSTITKKKVICTICI